MSNRNRKSDVLGIQGSRKTSSSKKEQGKEKLSNSINEEVKKMILKIQQDRAFVREDVSIANGKGGGENLEFYCEDFANNYSYSIKDSMKKKESKTETDVLLRPISELDEYKDN
ncbi:hypothetical protein [Planktothrix sp.]|uniref:hypothetical protein n=2 Tax=Planktothrix sp. TaxID=3088171 RepID=UPI0038D412DF